MKANISEKTGKTYAKALEKAEEETFIGKRVGEIVKLDKLGLTGYEAEIKGGSDNAGFPMRKSILGTKRKRALLTGGVGYRKPKNGEKKRKMVRGNQIAEDINQVNLKIVKEGKTPLTEIFKKEEKTEEQ